MFNASRSRSKRESGIWVWSSRRFRLVCFSQTFVGFGGKWMCIFLSSFFSVFSCNRFCFFLGGGVQVQSGSEFLLVALSVHQVFR